MTEVFNSACLKWQFLEQERIMNSNPLKTQDALTKKPASTLSVKRKQKGSRNFQAIQKWQPLYYHGVRK